MCIFSSSVVRSSARMTSSTRAESPGKKQIHCRINWLPFGWLHEQSCDPRRRTSFANPFNVAVQFTFKLLLATQLEKGLSILDAFSLFGKLSEKWDGKGEKRSNRQMEMQSISALEEGHLIKVSELRTRWAHQAQGWAWRRNQWWWVAQSRSSCRCSPRRRLSTRRVFVRLEAFLCVSRAYPVKNGRPSFHGNALENGQHGKEDIVERGDAVVGPLPAFPANGRVWTNVGTFGGFIGLHHRAWRLILVAF